MLLSTKKILQENHVLSRETSLSFSVIKGSAVNCKKKKEKLNIGKY